MLREITCLCLLWCVVFTASAQKKVLDEDAYKLWRRVEAQQISDDGKWVTYKYRYINAEEQERHEPVSYLRNMLSGKEIALDHVQQLNFFNRGKMLKYIVSHPAGEMEGSGKDSVFILSLHDMKRVYWDRPYGFTESAYSDRVTYSYPVGKNERGESIRRLVMWNVETNDSIVLDSVGHYMFIDNERKLLYEKDNGYVKKLCYTEIGGNSEVVYVHPEALLHDFSYDERKGEGTFTVCAGAKYRNSPNFLYSFTLPDGSYRLVMNFNGKHVPEGYKVSGRTYPVYGKGKYVFPDLERKNPPRPEKHSRRDTTFELELWTWNEEVSQKRQAHESVRNRRGVPKYVYRVKEENWLLVAPEQMELYLPPDHGELESVLVSDATPYRGMADWRDELAQDWYLVSLKSGERKLLFKDFRGTPVWSPNGKYALFYEKDRKSVV